MIILILAIIYLIGAFFTAGVAWNADPPVTVWDMAGYVLLWIASPLWMGCVAMVFGVLAIAYVLGQFFDAMFGD